MGDFVAVYGLQLAITLAFVLLAAGLFFYKRDKMGKDE